MIRFVQVALLAVLFLVPQTGWGRVGYVPKSTAPATKLTPAQQYRNKRIGKTNAGDVARRLKRSAWSSRGKRRYTPSVSRLAGTLKRRSTRFLWHKRTRRSRGGVRPRLQQRNHQKQKLRSRQRLQQLGARFDGNTFEGRMSLYREARIGKRQVRRFERKHTTWAAKYGLTAANTMLLGKVNKYLEAMDRLRERQERQNKISQRVGGRLARQASEVSPRRRAFVGRMLRQLRADEGPRFRIFTRGVKRGGLRGLWRVGSLRSLKRPTKVTQAQARRSTPPNPGHQRPSNWGYQPLLAP